MATGDHIKAINELLDQAEDLITRQEPVAAPDLMKADALSRVAIGRGLVLATSLLDSIRVELHNRPLG